MFWNAELEAIRVSLKCAHCGVRFAGSRSQAYKVKYESKKVNVFCTTLCRYAYMRGLLGKPVQLCGPCKKCGKMFESKRDAKFCSLDCYKTSDQFRAHWEKNTYLTPKKRQTIAGKRKTRKMANCLECGAEFWQKPCTGKKARKKKFCCTVCYRSYMAKRFDRWIANPERIALPQGYDGFLDRDELPCLIDGCGWSGKFLTLHMNQAHGVKADEFKRAAGFNLGTGVIGRSTAQNLRDRACVGIAAKDMTPEERVATLKAALKAITEQKEAGTIYKSMEGREHAKKTRLLLGHGPSRTCIGCGATFTQSTPFGRTLYCTIECRSKSYKKKYLELRQNTVVAKD